MGRCDPVALLARIPPEEWVKLCKKVEPVVVFFNAW